MNNYPIESHVTNPTVLVFLHRYQLQWRKQVIQRKLVAMKILITMKKISFSKKKINESTKEVRYRCVLDNFKFYTLSSWFLKSSEGVHFATSFHLLAHLGVHNIQATGVLNKNWGQTAEKEQTKRTWPLWTVHIKQKNCNFD